VSVPGPSVVRVDDAVAAARQAGSLFALSGVLALVGIPTVPDRAGVLVAIAVADVLVAAAAFGLPWRRWGILATGSLSVPGFVILGVSTWTFGGFATGTGPFFVLLFAWLGLHHSRRVILASIPLATISYAGALIAAGASGRLVGTTVVLIPVAAAVGLVIWSRVQGLREARLELEREHRWRTALMATLAHDVRSPLTTIRGTLEIIGDHDGLPNHFRPLLAGAERQTARITILSSNLLDMERVEAGRLRLDHEDVVLADLGRQVAELLGGSGIDVLIDADLVVRADRVRLEQMLVNLAANAIRHGSPPVLIAARADGESMVICVRDHGDGVPAEDQAQLFERLSSADRSPGSVGLGLWIVKMLAEAHGGSVGYRTASPGAEFTITLPGGSRLRSGAAAV
jgi:signal transduction histidine kinase